MNTDLFKFRVRSTKEESYGGYSASIHEDGHLSVHYWCKGEYATDTLGDGFEEGDYIIEKCTGLCDKNGKLIYEGDVVKNPAYPSVWFVVWVEDHARFDKINLCSYLRMKKDFPQKSEKWILNNTSSSAMTAEVEMECTEVIGNIHESKWGIEK